MRERSSETVVHSKHRTEGLSPVNNAAWVLALILPSRKKATCSSGARTVQPVDVALVILPRGGGGGASQKNM